MKFYLFFFLLLAPLWTSATIQTTVNADIAPQLSLASYTLVQSGSYYTSDNCPWQMNMGYAFSETYAGGTNLEFNGNSQGGCLGGWGCCPCAAIVWVGPGPRPPMVSDAQSTTEDGTGLVLYDSLLGATITGTTTDGTNVNTFTNNVGLQWGWENANYTASAPLQGGSESVSRTVVTILKLQTGGGAGSKLRNVFNMSASAQQVAPPIAGMCVDPDDPATICGNTTPTNGPVSIQTNWWTILPDNDNVVVTPTITSLNDYLFNLNPTKYNSYLELFTESANSSDVTLGHAFWRLSTDAPTNAFPSVPSTWLQFLGQCEGFYPDNKNDPYGYPGKLQNDNGQTPYLNLQRKFYISFPDLISALGATYQVQVSPPNYDLVGWNCANQACDIAYIAGMDEGILNFQTPSAVTGLLLRLYPGPALNNSEIYYLVP
jgi:hypothetical protein